MKRTLSSRTIVELLPFPAFQTHLQGAKDMIGYLERAYRLEPSKL